MGASLKKIFTRSPQPQPQVRISFRSPLRVSFLMRALRGRRLNATLRERTDRSLRGM